MRIDHIALYVHDLEAARDFFLTHFNSSANEGYHNPQSGLRTYFLSFAGGARLELMTRPNLADGATPAPCAGYAHVAFSLGGNEAVDALTERLRAAGCTVVSGPRVTGDGYYESCVLGPEGCVLELTA